MQLRQIAALLIATAVLAAPPADDGAAKLTVRPVLAGAEADDKASLTPDGRLMTMTDWSSGDIAIRDMSTGELKRLMAKTGGWESDDVGEYGVLSPDLRQAAYLWYEAGHSPHLRVISTGPGAKPRVLVKNSEFAYVIPTAWSLDGKSILVVEDDTDTQELSRILINHLLLRDSHLAKGGEQFTCLIDALPRCNRKKIC